MTVVSRHGDLDEGRRIALLKLARQLREAAAEAGRADVVAKVDEAIVLIAGAEAEAGQAGTDRGNLVIRILDGLGF
jgi:hypothetical protein